MLAYMRAADRKEVDMLRAPRCFGGESQFLLIGQNIDGSRFAGIRAAGKGDLGYLRIWQITEMIHRGEEAGLPKSGHRDQGEKAVGVAKMPVSYCTMRRCIASRKGINSHLSSC